GTSPQSDIYALGATLYHLLTGIKPPDALTRAAALVSSRPNPLRPADEINSVVGPELAAILNRAMAQNPDERYRSAEEFREALRCVGRTEEKPAIEFARQDEPEEYTLVAVPGETTVVRVDEITPKVSLGSRAIASVFVILLTAFGVFCNYYPGKIPAAAARDQVAAVASVSEMNQQPPGTDKVSAGKARRKTTPG